MRAGLRFGIAAFAAGLALGPLPALAQVVPQSATNTPATDTIGPRELQNFSLNGTVTRSAETPTPAPAPRSASRPPAAEPATTAPATAADTPRPSPTPRRQAAVEPARVVAQRAKGGPALALSPAVPTTASLPVSVAQPGFLPDAPPAPIAADQKFALWPSLLLAVVLGAGAAFLLLRRRSREAFAGGPPIDAFVAPEPAVPTPPRPTPSPPVPKAAPPARPVGIVASRLRPWIDVAFAPLACVVDDERVVIEFELQLTNSGSAPARDVLVEASLFNAGATQEQDIGAFFANPVGQGDRIEALAPLQSMTIRNSLIAPRQNIQLFELGGRQVFVPLVAFNVLYRVSSGPGQTSAAFMLGRETNSDKLGPLRADLGAKAFTRLGTRTLSVAVRR
ncbi:MAG: hypothetical protein ACJ8E3_08400 [Sphingomicrobium sp.]